MTWKLWLLVVAITLVVAVVVCLRTRTIDMHYVSDQVGRFALPMLMLLACTSILAAYGPAPDLLWPDAHIYFRATEAWIAGANPWTASYHGVYYGAPPPALLLNLPLLPFGENVAVAVWAGGGLAAVLLLLRRFRLPLWWIFFYPIAEGWTAASPDLVLAALVYANGGAITALVKPYSIPAILSERRWRTVAMAALLGLVTLPLLPWVQFFESRGFIANNFSEWAHPNSAWGDPLFMVGAAIALVLLRWQRGLALLTPAILSQQPHYALFSLEAISRSKLLAGFVTMPVPGAAAVGVMVYALSERWRAARATAGPSPRDIVTTPGTPLVETVSQ